MSRRWWSISTNALWDRGAEEVDVAKHVRDEGDKGGSADGLETDDKGRIYATDWQHDAIVRRLYDGTIETVAHDPRMLWPDTMSVADGWLYFTANQLHRQAQYQGGQDLRRYPYRLFRFPIDAGPVRLR
jgi:sugar lactone lactonase YvrE